MTIALCWLSRLSEEKSGVNKPKSAELLKTP